MTYDRSLNSLMIRYNDLVCASRKIDFMNYRWPDEWFYENKDNLDNEIQSLKDNLNAEIEDLREQIINCCSWKEQDEVQDFEVKKTDSGC